MRRGYFEELLRRHLDIDLAPLGLHLVPQPPEDVEDANPSAVFEADANEFGQRYPALDNRNRGNTICVDLWIHLDPVTGKFTAELDGAPLEALLDRFGVSDLTASSGAPQDASSQLSLLARRVVSILQAARTGGLEIR
jgi:hypothetical protein